MNESFVILRDTISKRTQEYKPAQAEKWLNHPVFGKHLEVVRSGKREVLAEPYVIENGKRQYIDGQGNRVSKAKADHVEVPTEPTPIATELPDAPENSEDKN